MSIKNSKNSTLKKIMGIVFVVFIFIASIVAIVFSSFNIVTKTNLSSDFDEGISYSLRFKLVDKNNKPLYQQTTDEQGFKINDEKDILNKLDDTASILGKQLQNMGLTNVSLSSGLGSYSYTEGTNVLKSIPIGYINMNFENSPAVFGITTEEDDLFLNASKISSKIGDSNRYEFETVRSSYSPYQDLSLPSTSRIDRNSSIIANESGISQNQNYFLVSSKENLVEDINKYKNAEGIIDNNAVQLVQSDYYYIKPFIDQKFEFDKIQDASSEASYNFLDSREDEETTPPPTEGGDSNTETQPDPKAQFQTKHTWLLWKNKTSLINYLNSLVLSSYYNIYANNIQIYSIENDTYVVGTPERDHSTNTNAIDTDLRKQINKYLDSLSSLEKNIVKFVTNTSRGQPTLITEKNLMGFLYEFYNSKYNPTNNVGIPGSTESDKIIDPNNHSKSEIAGWGFLETDNSDFSELLSPYLIGKFDYSNFGEFFQNPEPPKNDEEENQDQDNDEPVYYTTNKFKLPNQSSDINEFINSLDNYQYNFPILDVSKDDDIDNLNLALKATQEFNKEIYEDKYGSVAGEIFKDNENYKKRLKEIASNFSYQKIFGDMSKTIPRYDRSAFYDFSVFNIFLICLSAVILLVGIVVSVLYRIPGVLSFLFTALTFTGSIAFFNLFGFTFSFFSFIGLLFGTVISFLTPLFVFRNFKKEILEGSSIFGAFVKTMKKYWKLSLDVHVVSILISFSFLFFGKNQIIDFGAVLTISTFLSLILSGVLFFLCISLIISIFNYLSPKSFMTNSLFLKMKKFTQSISDISTADFNNIESKNLLSKISHKTKWGSFYNKIWIWSIIAIIFVCLIGFILLFIIGPGFSIDFSGGNIIKIYNYDKFSSLINNNFNMIPNYLGNGAYVYDNVLYVPVSRIDNFAVVKWIKQLTMNDLPLQNLLLNSYSITEFNSSIPLSVVSSAWACFGISIGFVACWILISINWVAIVPYIFVQCISMIISIGWIGLSRFELNIDSISIIILIYLVSSVYSVGILSTIKISWDRSKPLSLEELKVLTNSIVSKINSNFIYTQLILIIVGVTISIVSLNWLLFVAFFTLIIGISYVIVATPHILLPLWHYAIKVKNIYMKELSNSSMNKTKVKAKNYDNIDEQIVKGLNSK